MKVWWTRQYPLVSSTRVTPFFPWACGAPMLSKQKHATSQPPDRVRKNRLFMFVS